MKGKKDKEEKNEDVTNLAFEAATIAATWDEEMPAEFAASETQEAQEVQEAAPDAETAAAIEAELGATDATAIEESPQADESGENDGSAEAAEAAGTAGTAGTATEEAFIAEEDTLPKELSEVQAKSIIESVLFATVHPVSFAGLRGLFHGTNVNSDKLRDILNHMQTDYAGGERGITLDETAGGYQFRTKLDNAPWLRKMVKARPFKLSGPALEVLSIVAYKQPVTKAEVDQIRGVESGHLMRALMEKNIVKFAGKSELPGKPMLYGTTKQFLELFGLRNIRELPTLSEIDKLIPEGIGEISEIEGETLGSLADKIAVAPGKSYSESETELLSITEQLAGIDTTTAFFEQEKQRERDRRDQERAQDLRERKIMGEMLPEVDAKWLARFEAKIEALAHAQSQAQAEPAPQTVAEPAEAPLVSPGSGLDELAAEVDIAAMTEETLEAAALDVEAKEFAAAHEEAPGEVDA